MALKAARAGYLPPVLYSSLTAAEPMMPPAQSPTLRFAVGKYQTVAWSAGFARVDGEHASLALDVLLLHRHQQQPLLGRHGGAVEVGADEVVPDDGEVGAPEAVHVAGARGDVEVLADRGGGGLQGDVVLVVGVARVAEQQPLMHDDGLLPVQPRLRLQRVERVEPAALDPDVEEAVVEEPAAVAVAAVVPGLRHRQPPELLAAAERHRAQRRHGGIVDLERVAAARPGDDDVLVVGARRRGIQEHRRAALDDVGELVGPDDLAGLRVDAAQVVRVGTRDDVGPAAVDDDVGLAGPPAPRPLARLVLVVLAGAPVAAQVDLPEQVEVLGQRPETVEPAAVVAEEGPDLDAVAGQRRDRRRRDRPRLGDRLARAAAAAAGARRGAPHEQDDDDGEDEESEAAPAPELALTLR